MRLAVYTSNPFEKCWERNCKQQNIRNTLNATKFREIVDPVFFASARAPRIPEKHVIAKAANSFSFRWFVSLSFQSYRN